MTRHASRTASQAEQLNRQLDAAFREARLIQAVSIGHQTGLLESLIHFPGSGVRDVAESLGLNGEFVCKWLNILVDVGLVERTADTSRYTLPHCNAKMLGFSTDGPAETNRTNHSTSEHDDAAA